MNVEALAIHCLVFFIAMLVAIGSLCQSVGPPLKSRLKYGWISMKFSADIDGAQKVNPARSRDPYMCHLVPSSGRKLYSSNTLVNDK